MDFFFICFIRSLNVLNLRQPYNSLLNTKLKVLGRNGALLKLAVLPFGRFKVQVQNENVLFSRCIQLNIDETHYANNDKCILLLICIWWVCQASSTYYTGFKVYLFYAINLIGANLGCLVCKFCSQEAKQISPGRANWQL